MPTHFQQFILRLEQSLPLEEKIKSNFELIDLFYDNQIHQVENTEPPIIGKKKVVELEKQYYVGITHFSIKVKNTIYDPERDLAWGAMIIHFERKGAKKKRLDEAFFQRWENGKIVYQRFFYGDAKEV